VIIADTSGLLAYFKRDEPQHAVVSAIVEAATEPLVVSPFVVAELDYLVGTRLGVDAELAVVRELSTGAYDLPILTPSDLDACAAVIDKYRDQDLGVTDASLVVLAKRYGTRDILTLDRRHFEVVRPLTGGRFRLVGS
jgi:predicted nucleic acid-binding protein